MKIEIVKISDLKPSEYNPRVLTEKQGADIKNSLTRFGFVDPIVVNKNPERQNIIIGGHQRVKVWELMGNDEVPVFYVDLPIEEEKELNVRLNKNTGEWDWDILANEFDMEKLEEWGFSEAEFNGGWGEPEQVETEGDDDVPETQEEPLTVKGDLYELGGNHRVLCGDSIIIDDVEKLMGGEKADMVFTDPPYGISFKSNFREKTPKFESIKNDDVVLDITNSLMLIMEDNSVAYICTRWDIYPKWHRQIDSILDIKNCVVWYKKGGGLGDLINSYSPNHELIIVAHNGKGKLRLKRESDVWEIGRDGFNDYKHPTQKPIELSQFAVENHSDKDNTVVDLFLGSGSTLIACEKTDRKCYGMEISEKYCDVIVKRYVDFCKKNNRPYSVKRNGEQCRDFDG